MWAYEFLSVESLGFGFLLVFLQGVVHRLRYCGGLGFVFLQEFSQAVVEEDSDRAEDGSPSLSVAACECAGTVGRQG